MSSDLRKTILNTRERWTSTKYNKQVQIHDRNLQEALRHITQADENLSGVVSGLVPSVNSGTFDITVGRGLALLFDSGKSSPDSQYRWIEIEGSENVTVPAADPANPRWDVIEIAPGVTNTGLIARDIFDPTLGTFSSQNVTVEETPEPVLQVRSGTPAASPAFPSGATGQIPLAYVFVPAAAASLPTDGLVFCRPVLRPPGAADEGSDVLGGQESEGDVRGGGIYVPATGGVAFRMQEVSGRWARHRMRWGIPRATELSLVTNMFDGTFPAADQIVYFYAAEAPYPSGYDALAPREFQINGATAAGQFVTADETMSNCIVVASDLEPNEETIRGAVGIGGTMTLLDPPFGGSASLARSEMVYLGAADYEDGTADLKSQDIVGHRVMPTERSPAAEYTTSGTSVSVWSQTAIGVGQSGIAPSTAQAVHAIILGELIASSTVHFQVGHEALERDDAIATSNGGGNINFRLGSLILYPDKTNGNITLTWSTEAGSGLNFDPQVVVQSYEDAILARR